MIYVGLTDDHERRRAEHGSPSDRQAWGPFDSESAARAWEKAELAKPGTSGGPGGAGWRYGYKYTISYATRE